VWAIQYYPAAEAAGNPIVRQALKTARHVQLKGYLQILDCAKILNRIVRNRIV
jgi:hypothetical protein